MLLDANALGAEAHFDYCIVGSGPAGITLALGLESTGKRIALLEAGEETVTGQSQALYDGTVVGDPYFSLAGARLRCFGGTSNHWSGWCAPLEEADFLPKPYCPDGITVQADGPQVIQPGGDMTIPGTAMTSRFFPVRTAPTSRSAARCG
jgi:choline dehydrogenase-like flavoprotein